MLPSEVVSSGVDFIWEDVILTYWMVELFQLFGGMEIPTKKEEVETSLNFFLGSIQQVKIWIPKTYNY